MAAEAATRTSDPRPPEGGEPADGAAQSSPRSVGARLLQPVVTGLHLVLAAHPRLTLLTAGGLGLGAFLAGRPGEEVALVFATGLLGQAIQGWHNDIVDRDVDARHERPRKPIAAGRLDPATAWFAIACAALLLLPLAVANGGIAAGLYLLAVGIGLGSNVVLRGSMLSWAPWAAQYALYTGFLSYGGFGGLFQGVAPAVPVAVAAAVLGVLVHIVVSLPGLIADNREGRRHLPLRLALRLGAPRLLALALVAAGAAAIVLIALGARYGLGA